MKYVNLGRSGLKVSRLCLGCMSYGEPERLPQPWSLDEKASRPLIRQALEAGINFFDTANIYSGGSSEEITGKALREMARRDEIVVATKTFFPWRNISAHRLWWPGALQKCSIQLSVTAGPDL
ncbi:General stress protein 69 [Mixta intestinalis]|uniref:General stress protein 69 n=1 Tax=Mixta intestinalis TaxID=1615494 RepID=A0A6P1PXD6_9GAMM|nr:General stress protein 69 [Mixta intestinalis]